MNWLPVVGSLVGVIGLLYGLLERSKRQAADRKADTFFHSYEEERKAHEATRIRLEAVIATLKSNIDKLRKELDANLPPDKLRDRLNDLFKWRFLSPQTGSAEATTAGLPSGPTSSDEPSGGTLGG